MDPICVLPQSGSTEQGLAVKPQGKKNQTQDYLKCYLNFRLKVSVGARSNRLENEKVEDENICD